ncbi:MAG: nucleotidyltransferase [Spirochaetes bacterium]|nr:MAG: nucleotidyltransferase [Spirochaetota bacterium]
MENRIAQTLARHRHLLEKYHVRKIGLFGSYARGDESEGSDIDLLVEFDEGAFGANYAGYFDAMSSLSEQLESILGAKIDLVTQDMLSPHIAPEILGEVRFIEGV